MPENSASNAVEPVHRRHHERPLGPHRRPRSAGTHVLDINGVALHVRASCRTTSTTAATAATILSVAVGKGRDYAWSGAVDGLRVNDTVFDFEERGVFTTAP